jgi:ferritin-like metal-binding protein YciE
MQQCLGDILEAATALNKGKEQMPKMKSLKDLYVDELKDLYNAEKQIIAALPKMAKAATTPELKAAFEEHLEVTRNQVQRLDQVFQELGTKGTGKVCKAMEGLVQEAKDLMEEDAEPMVMDAALIASAQRIEHYEIAGYGCVRTYARMLGFTNAEQLLNETLQEEGDTDQKLTMLAETHINADAQEGENGQMAGASSGNGRSKSSSKSSSSATKSSSGSSKSSTSKSSSSGSKSGGAKKTASTRK